METGKKRKNRYIPKVLKRLERELNSMKDKIKKLVISVVIISSIFAGMSYADDETTTAAEKSISKNSVKVVFEFEESQGSDKTPLPGATYSIWKVASMDSYDTDRPNATFTITNDFKNAGVDLSSTSDSSEAENAAKLYSSAKTPLSSKVTDENGSVTFENLDNGLYLLAETDKTGTAAAYTNVDPFIIMAPLYEDGKWVNDVTVYPKSTVTKNGTTYHSKTPHETPVETIPVQPGTVIVNPNKPSMLLMKIPSIIKRFVQTSDPSHMIYYLSAVILATGMLISWIIIAKKRKNDEM